jgi:hypothetical protein
MIVWRTDRGKVGTWTGSKRRLSAQEAAAALQMTTFGAVR